MSSVFQPLPTCSSNCKLPASSRNTVLAFSGVIYWETCPLKPSWCFLVTNQSTSPARMRPARANAILSECAQRGIGCQLVEATPRAKKLQTEERHHHIKKKEGNPQPICRYGKMKMLKWKLWKLKDPFWKWFVLLNLDVFFFQKSSIHHACEGTTVHKFPTNLKIKFSRSWKELYHVDLPNKWIPNSFGSFMCGVFNGISCTFEFFTWSAPCQQKKCAWSMVEAKTSYATGSELETATCPSGEANGDVFQVFGYHRFV